MYSLEKSTKVKPLSHIPLTTYAFSFFLFPLHSATLTLIDVNTHTHTHKIIYPQKSVGRRRRRRAFSRGRPTGGGGGGGIYRRRRRHQRPWRTLAHSPHSRAAAARPAIPTKPANAVAWGARALLLEDEPPLPPAAAEEAPEATDEAPDAAVDMTEAICEIGDGC